MKTLILNLILFSSIILNGKEKLEIYFNSDDCSNCNNIIRCIRNLDGQINKFFYLTIDNEAIVDEVFKNLDLSPKDFNIKYLPGDFFQCKKKGCPTSVIPSYCVYSDISGEKDSFSLKELPGKISFLKKNKWQNKENLQYNSYEIKKNLNQSPSNLTDAQKLNDLSLLIPDSIKISKSIRVFVRDSIINILDLLLNKNVTIQLNTNFSKLKKITVINGNDLNPGPFMALDCFDTAFYRGAYSRLKLLGQHLPKLVSTFVSDTTINIMLNFYYVRYPNPNSLDSFRLHRKVHPLSLNDTIIDIKYFMYSKNIKTNKSRLQCISNMSFENNKYWLISLPFFFEKSKLYASIRNSDKPNDEAFLGEFIIQNNRLEFSSLHKNTTKDLKIESLSKNQILNRDVNSDFYFTTSMPFIFDFVRNEDFLLDKNDFNLTEPIFIKDVLRNNSKIYLLVLEGEQVFCYTFDDKTKKREDKKLINAELKAKQINIKFLSSNKYLIMDGNTLQILNY